MSSTLDQPAVSLSRRGFLSAVVATGSAARGEDRPALPGEPVEPVSFRHAGVTDAWAAYRGKLTFGKGQTLALLDDGCKLSMPEWSKSDGDVPKVLVSYDS